MALQIPCYLMSVLGLEPLGSATAQKTHFLPPFPMTIFVGCSWRNGLIEYSLAACIGNEMNTDTEKCGLLLELNP